MLILSEEASEDDDCILKGWKIFGVPVIICAKMRPMIVLAVYRGHLLAAPMSTHGGKGTIYKSPEQQAEAIHLRTPEDTEEWWETVPAERVVNVKNGKREGSVFYPSQVLTVDYNFPITSIGHVECYDVDRFLGLIRTSLDKGQAPTEPPVMSTQQWAMGTAPVRLNGFLRQSYQWIFMQWSFT